MVGNSGRQTYNPTMDKGTVDKQTEEISALVGDLFSVAAYYQSGNRLVLSLHRRYQRDIALKLLEDRLKLSGYEFSLDSKDEAVLLTIDPKRHLRIPRLNIILFIVTLFSAYVVPVFLFNLPYGRDIGEVLSQTLADLERGKGIEFTLALMSILLVHEMGHFVASRHRSIITSWPYFIPAPNIIGTFGAIIKSKSPFRNRRDLIEVGAAGPIAGWIVAFGWLVYGFSHSTIVSNISPVDQTGIVFTLVGESLLVKTLAPAIIGKLTPGYSYLFTEAAFAGWVGLLVTAMNMLPIGQLDGGHVLYGLVRRRQALLGWLAMAGLIILGFTAPMWWVFAALGFIFKVAHPPTLDDRRQPSRVALLMGWVALIIFVISFTPVPFQ